MTEHRGWMDRRDQTIRKELPEDADEEMWLPLYTLPDLVGPLRRTTRRKTEELVQKMSDEDYSPTVVTVANEFISAIENELRSEGEQAEANRHE